jgi:hypothetical protein
MPLEAGAFLQDLHRKGMPAVVAQLQRRRARRQGLRGGQVGAVSFIPFFGSALQVTPDFHSQVPDGVFRLREDGVRFEALPRPRKQRWSGCWGGRPPGAASQQHSQPAISTIQYDGKLPHLDYQNTPYPNQAEHPVMSSSGRRIG